MAHPMDHQHIMQTSLPRTLLLLVPCNNIHRGTTEGVIEVEAFEEVLSVVGAVEEASKTHIGTQETKGHHPVDITMIRMSE